VLVTDQKIESIRDIIPILEQVRGQHVTGTLQPLTAQLVTGGSNEIWCSTCGGASMMGCKLPWLHP
jgi:hypothetical protein